MQALKIQQKPGEPIKQMSEDLGIQRTERERNVPSAASENSFFRFAFKLSSILLVILVQIMQEVVLRIAHRTDHRLRKTK